MGILGGIVFAALAGWVASMFVGNNSRQGCLGNVIVGVVGAVIGGFLVQLFGPDIQVWAWSWTSFGVAVLGSIVLLLLTGAGSRNNR